jgi:hypothetical protein
MNELNIPRVPMQFVGGIAEFSELLISIELIRGRSKSDAESLLALIPESLRQVPCFLDRMTRNWLYDFGDPVMTSNGCVHGVGKTWHLLTRLIDVVTCARVRLEQSVLTDYLTRLVDPRKHTDMLFEFAPILRLDPATVAEYEVTGESPGNRKIDWKIKGQNGFTLLLEVKNRETDLIRSFERVEAGERAVDGTVPAPDHDTDLLFKSVESKFLSRSPGQVLQGVWVGSALMQESSELEQSFCQLDPSKVHFAVLGTWDGAVHLLVRYGVPREKIVQTLQVHEVDRLVFRRPEDG